jgi:hypothetical protein
MPERTSAIPTWAWIVGAVLVIVSIFTGYRMVQTQQHLAAAQSELESAKQAAGRRTLSATSYRPNWMTLHHRSDQPNPYLRRRSIA